MKSTNKEKSLAYAIAEQDAAAKRYGIVGIGEIIDDGLLSKAELAKLHPIISNADMDREIDKMIAFEMEFAELFGLTQTLTRDEAREKIIRRNAYYQAIYDAAPEQHVYDYHYYL